MIALRVTKRDAMSRKKEYTVRILAVALSIVFAGVIMLLFGLDPLKIFKSLIVGSVGTQMRIKQTLIKAIPLCIASLGISVAFKMKFWNIGAEGQITLGAAAATFVALNLGEATPRPVMLAAMAAAAILAGGIWAFIPAIFKAKLGTNETIFTLMLNYIAIKFVMYLQYGPWIDPAAQGFPKIAMFSGNAILPEVFGLHIGWIIALILVVFVYVFINKTKKGYEISVVGQSVETARYAGMNISSIIITAMLLSGGMCGLVGMIQASAIEKSLVYGIANNYGFTAIITAWLARLHSVAILFVCVVFAMLIQGGAYIQIAMNVPSSVASIVQGTILFFVLGSEFFLQYKVGRVPSLQKEVA
jgi:simple sugar transport system permease protein